MSNQYDSKGELRAAYLARELKAAKHSVPGGGVGVFMRVTLAVIFLYLMFFTYATLGVSGLVLLCTLLLAALLTPLLYHAAKAIIDRQRSRAEQVGIAEEPEVRWEG